MPISSSKHPNRTLKDFYDNDRVVETEGGASTGKDGGNPRPKQDNLLKEKPEEELPSAYHFSASLAKGASNQLSLQRPEVEGPNGNGNLDQSVDLDLSFDYVSKLEKKTKVIQLGGAKVSKMVGVELPVPQPQQNEMKISISPPSPQPPRGMSSANWSSRKGPPTPLALKLKSHSKKDSNPQEISVFSPDTEVSHQSEEEGDDGALPLTPLSATRRSASINPDFNEEVPFGTDPMTGEALPLSPSMQKVMASSVPLTTVELPKSRFRSPPTDPLPPVPLPVLSNKKSDKVNALGLDLDGTSSQPQPPPMPDDENTRPSFSKARTSSSRSRNPSRTKRPDTGNSNVSGKSFETANTRPSTDGNGTNNGKRESFESFETAGEEDESMVSVVSNDRKEILTSTSNSKFNLPPTSRLSRFSHSQRPSIGAISSSFSDGLESSISNRNPGGASPSNSHSSPRTPFSPLFSDPGTAKSGWTMATSNVLTPGSVNVKLPEERRKSLGIERSLGVSSVEMSRGGSAPGNPSSGNPKAVVHKSVERLAVGLPRSETEEWIKSQEVQQEEENLRHQRKREKSDATSNSESSSNYEEDDLEVDNALKLTLEESTEKVEIPKKKRRPTLIVSTNSSQADEEEFSQLFSPGSEVRQSEDGSNRWPQSPLLLSPTTLNQDVPALPLDQLPQKALPTRRAMTSVDRSRPSQPSELEGDGGIGLGLELDGMGLGLGPRCSLSLPASSSLRKFHSENSLRGNYLQSTVPKKDHFEVDMSPDLGRNVDQELEEDGFGGLKPKTQKKPGLSLASPLKGNVNLPDPPMTAPLLNGWRKSENGISGNEVGTSPSMTSSLEGFACHVTPPVPSAINLNSSVQVRRASFTHDYNTATAQTNSDIHQLPVEDKSNTSNGRWSSRFWSVASSAGLTSVLSSKRNSENLPAKEQGPISKPGQMKSLNLVNKRNVDSRRAAEISSQQSHRRSRSREDLTNLISQNGNEKDGIASAPASSAFGSNPTFESNSTNSTSPTTQNSSSVTSRKQKRTSRIRYISNGDGNGNEFRLDMNGFNQVEEKKVFDPLDLLKSPRVRDSPTGQTPDIHSGLPISRSKWGVLPQNDESHEQIEAQEEMERNRRRHSSILPIKESDSGEVPLWMRGQDDGGLQASRDRLRLLASQTMPGATLPHQYLAVEGVRKRVTTSRPSHRPTSSTSAIPTASIVPFGWTSVKNRRSSMMHTGTLIRDSNGIPLTTRFAPGTNVSPEDQDQTDSEFPTSGRPMSIFVPTSSIEAHLLRNSGLKLGKSQRFSILNHFTPKTVLESSKPSKTLFFAGCLGMPWLWLIGGWWLGEDGLIITNGLERIEMWQHEASMRKDGIEDESFGHSAEQSEQLSETTLNEDPNVQINSDRERSSSLPPTSNPRRESFRRSGSAPPEIISMPSKSMAKMRSHSTLRSISSSNGSMISPTSESIPKRRTESIASILALKPEVAFFQSPIRPIPEGWIEGKESPRIDNEDGGFGFEVQKASGVDQNSRFEGSSSSLHSRKKSRSTINMGVENQLKVFSGSFQPSSTFEEEDEDQVEGGKSSSKNKVSPNQVSKINQKPLTAHQTTCDRLLNYLVYLGNLDRFVLYNRIASVVAGLFVFGAWGVAMLYLVSNF